MASNFANGSPSSRTRHACRWVERRPTRRKRPGCYATMAVSLGCDKRLRTNGVPSILDAEVILTTLKQANLLFDAGERARRGPAMRSLGNRTSELFHRSGGRALSARLALA